MSSESTAPPDLAVERTEAALLRIKVSGNWRISGAMPDLQPIREAVQAGPVAQAVEFDCAGVVTWDARFLNFINQCHALCEARGLEFRDAGLPKGIRQLLRLARAVPEKKDAQRGVENSPPLERIGVRALKLGGGTMEMFTFLGSNVIALGRLLRGRAQFRWADAWLVMQQCGPEALGIVALINFLVGLIIAFVGAVGLAKFGASIFVADMVAIGTVREMGCLMTGIILCGRTGAAFAAQLGTMKVNEEITAFETFGISPIEFLVLPRLIALVLMMPLLCIFADAISILGGFTVSVLLLDVTATEYLTRTLAAIQLPGFLLGVAKGSFFGFLVAFTGCLRGMQCGNNAAAVGEATTRAVVAGITAIIAADGVFAVICNALHL